MLTFRKMHGLGNDFVVLDGRAAPLGLTSAQIVALADRRRGIGCDQLIILEPVPYTHPTLPTHLRGYFLAVTAAITNTQQT